MRECVNACVNACVPRANAAPLLPFSSFSLAHLPAMPATAMINSNVVLTALRFRVCNAMALCYNVRIYLFFKTPTKESRFFSTNART